MKSVAIGLLVLSALAPAQDRRTFTGVITDDMCAEAGHASMRMGPTDAECTRYCVMLHNGMFVLADGTTIYLLSDQTAAEAFAAQKVRVVGTLDEKTRTIRVQSIIAAT